jgi:hypothetical protein
MKTEGSLPFSEDPGTVSYPEPPWDKIKFRFVKSRLSIPPSPLRQRQYSVWLLTGRPRFDPLQWWRISSLTSASRPALGPTQAPAQWVPGALSPGVKRGRSVMLTTHPLLAPRLRKSGSYTSCHPNAPLWSVTGPLYLTLHQAVSCLQTSRQIYTQNFLLLQRVLHFRCILI